LAFGVLQDFSIVKVALPSIRRERGLAAAAPQWWWPGWPR
jgi:hypothetical protein